MHKFKKLKEVLEFCDFVMNKSWQYMASMKAVPNLIKIGCYTPMWYLSAWRPHMSIGHFRWTLSERWLSNVN